MTRWFVGVKFDGTREVFAEPTGEDPKAAVRGYTDAFGPYRSESEATRAARSKPSRDRGSLRQRRKR